MTLTNLAVMFGALLLLAVLCALVSVLDPDLARMRQQEHTEREE